jgi:hypothetical protein
LVSNAGSYSAHYGIWSSRADFETVTVVAKVTCDAEGYECAKKDNSKCKASKAFVIFGILANVGALVLLAVGIGPPVGVALTAAIAGLCYLIVWAIFAGEVSTKPENCGLKGFDYELGGAFGCTIVAWLLCWAGAAAAFMSGKSEG